MWSPLSCRQRLGTLADLLAIFARLGTGSPWLLWPPAFLLTPTAVGPGGPEFFRFPARPMPARHGVQAQALGRTNSDLGLWSTRFVPYPLRIGPLWPMSNEARY